MVQVRDEWMSPRTANQRVQDAAFLRAEEALHGIDRKNKQVQQYELQQLELVAAFMRLEAKEQQQREALTTAFQQKQRAAARRRARSEQQEYHARSSSSGSAASPGYGMPREPDKVTQAATVRAAQRMQREALDLQVAAQRAAQHRVAERQAAEVAEMFAADERARRSELQSRDDRTVEQKTGIASEWERQQELSARVRGDPGRFGDTGPGASAQMAGCRPSQCQARPRAVLRFGRRRTCVALGHACVRDIGALCPTQATLPTARAALGRPSRCQQQSGPSSCRPESCAQITGLRQARRRPRCPVGVPSIHCTHTRWHAPLAFVCVM